MYDCFGDVDLTTYCIPLSWPDHIDKTMETKYTPQTLAGGAKIDLKVLKERWQV